MWTLRRGAIHLKNRGFSLGATRICSDKSEIARCYLENCTARFVETQERTFAGLLSSARFSNKFHSSSKSGSEVRMSSQVGEKSSGEEEDDLDDGFSELETPIDGNKHDLISESELSKEEGVSDDTQNKSESLGNKRFSKFKTISPMARAIIDSPEVPVRKVVEKWVEEGNEVTQTEASSAMLFLRKRTMYIKALQLSEWLESSKHIEFQETHYASRVDLIAKVHGTTYAEEYINKIPESFRGEWVHRTLLANYVAKYDVKKSAEMFNRMKKLGFPVSTFSCNQLLFLYLKTDKKKIADVLTLMEKENIKPSLFTYQILINAKGLCNDITGMEKIVETMKAEGVEPSTQILVSLASHYANAGINDKAEAILKQLEGGNLTKNRWVCQHLLPVYASMEMVDEVERVWNICEPNAWLKECLAAVTAWGKLGRIEKAEAAFNKMMKMLKRPTSKQFMSMLNVYADHKLLEKAKDLVKRMGDSGCNIGPPVWDALVRLYIKVGNVEKADSMLEKVAVQKKGMFTSYFAILECYARRGDVHNTEKMFAKMRKVGYAPQVRQYQTLLQAYVNAKIPAYGFAERMEGDNVFPNTVMANQLAQLANAYRRPEIADLLE